MSDADFNYLWPKPLLIVENSLLEPVTAAGCVARHKRDFVNFIHCYNHPRVYQEKRLSGSSSSTEVGTQAHTVHILTQLHKKNVPHSVTDTLDANETVSACFTITEDHRIIGMIRTGLWGSAHDLHFRGTCRQKTPVKTSKPGALDIYDD